MIAEGLTTLVEFIGRAASLEANGGDWVPKWFRRVEHERLPEYPVVQLHTLYGVADYMNKNADMMEAMSMAEAFFVVTSPTSVELVLPHGDPSHGKRRQIVASASVSVPEPRVVGMWVPVEEALIELKSCFDQGSDDLDAVCKLLGNVRDESIRTQRDDGVTQIATVQEQVGIDESMPVPIDVMLAPHRTFPEVEQPTSPFLLRLKRDEQRGVLACLFASDNEGWRVEAVRNVADYLREVAPRATVLA